MSLLVVPVGAIALWIRNLSLDCISGGASFCACIVTTKSTTTFSVKNQYNYNLLLLSKNVSVKFYIMVFHKTLSLRDYFDFNIRTTAINQQREGNVTCDIAWRTRQNNTSIRPNTVLFGVGRLNLSNTYENNSSFYTSNINSVNQIKLLNLQISYLECNVLISLVT